MQHTNQTYLMIKKKILCWCDFIAPTGFGNVAKNLLDELHLYYDVSIVGINYQGDKKYDTSKYFVYPITREDVLGVKRLYNIAERDQPDLIFLFQDIFHISDIIEKLKKVSPKSKIVIYFPVDGYPFSAAWKNALELSDAVITYTDWAIKVIKEKFPQFNKPIHKLYHGTDTSVFYPQPIELIEENRKKANWSQKFVIINVNRFQPRKAIPLSVRAFSMFAKGYKKCKCGHAMPLANTYCEVNMCPPEDIIFTQDDKKDDVYYYLHMSAMEGSMGQNRTCLLQNHLINAGFTNEDYSRIIGINAKKIYADEVPEAELNNLYNASNLNITVSGGEGKLLENTLIITDKGYKCIEEIVEDDMVLNANGKFARVNKTLATKFTKPMYSIRLSKFSEPIIASHDHPFLTEKNEYVEAANLKVNDKIVFQIPDYSHLPKITEIDLLDYNKNNSAFESTNKYFISKQTLDKKRFARKIKITKELCKFFGLYTAEGSCFSGTLSFSFHQKEIELHKFVSKIYNKYFNIYKDYTTPSFKNSNKDASVNVQMAGTLLQNFLHESFGRKAMSKKIPIWIFNLPNTHKQAFLDGLILGDGNIDKKRHKVRLTTSSKYLAYGTRDLYLTLGKVPSVNFQDNSHGYGNNFIYKVDLSEDHTTNKNDGRFRNTYELINSRVILKILSIKLLKPKGIGHDLEVPDGKSFTTAQCTVSNCGLSLLESAATGTPSLAPRNSAIPEMLNGTGTLVSNNGVYSHPMDNAHIRPIVNVEEMMLRLEDYYNKWKAEGKEKTIDQACINNINANFLWPDKREILHKIFKEILEKK